MSSIDLTPSPNHDTVLQRLGKSDEVFQNVLGFFGRTDYVSRRSLHLPMGRPLPCQRRTDARCPSLAASAWAPNISVNRRASSSGVRSTR